MRKTKRSLLFSITAVAFLTNCKEKDLSNKGNQSVPCEISTDNILTWDDIYDLRITNTVSETIVIRSKLYWNTAFYYIDSIPTIRPAGQIKLLFENSDLYISNPSWHGEGRGDLFLRSNEILKYDSQKDSVEKYSLNGEDLSNGKEYYLFKGRIEYRDWLNVGPSRLADTNFINQSNNVVYWSQTFKFVSDEICKDD